MKRLLTTTTAFSMAFSSVTPFPLFAQTEVRIGDQVVICLTDAETPCPDGAICVVVKQAKNCQARAEKTVATLGARSKPKATVAEQATQDVTAAQNAAAEQAAQVAAAKAEAKAQAAQEATAAQSAAAEQAAAEQAAQVAAAKAEAQAQAAQEATAAQAAAAEQAAAEQAAQVAAAKAEAKAQAAQEAAAAKAGAKAQAAQEATVAEAATAQAAAEQAAAAASLSTILTGNPDGEDVSPAPIAAASDTGVSPIPSVAATVTEVTASDSRSSGEEFVDTSATAAAAASAEPAAGKKKKKGLSNLEKFGLVVLGGLAVGAILNNGDKVVSNTGDRVVVQRDDGRYVVLKDDDTLVRRPGSTVSTENYSDGSTRSIVEREDGSQIITIRDASGRVLRRSRIGADGREVLLIDDLTPVERIDVSALPKPRPGGMLISTESDGAALRAAMLALEARDLGRSFSLRQIREYPQVRALAPTIDVESITFDTGSAAIRAAEAGKLSKLGRLMAEMVAENPTEMFLIEGHTDAIGSEAANLALSDRRAESLALALNEYFGVPPENLVVQGYGEAELRIDTQANEPLNRRAAVRIITPLLQRLASR
ncbi:MAG: OmpA family protein [Paracoccaceae bacterium]|nr:OmpA family protein [Paracoccaceae bacterium]